jgi:hypothetical protein
MIETKEDTTIQEALTEWNSGGTIWSVELGGLGPRYEQCIQVLMFELCKDNLETPLPKEGDDPEDKKYWRSWGDETINRLDKTFGFSGAQVGAAKAHAWKFLKYGYGCMIEKAREQCPGRMIQVSKEFPRMEDK